MDKEIGEVFKKPSTISQMKKDDVESITTLVMESSRECQQANKALEELETALEDFKKYYSTYQWNTDKIKKAIIEMFPKL